MIFRNAEQAAHRAQSLGITVVEEGDQSSPLARKPFVRAWIENATNARIAIARTLVSWLGNFSDCELLVSEFGIWPSSEDENLYQRLRAAYGGTGELYEAPAHFFAANEIVDLESFVHVTLLFGWGGYVIPNPPTTYLFISHDGWVLAQSSEGHSKITADLERMGIEYETGGGSLRSL
jgi:hypothetical protein